MAKRFFVFAVVVAMFMVFAVAEEERLSLATLLSFLNPAPVTGGPLGQIMPGSGGVLGGLLNSTGSGGLLGLGGLLNITGGSGGLLGLGGLLNITGGSGGLLSGSGLSGITSFLLQLLLLPVVAILSLLKTPSASVTVN